MSSIPVKPSVAAGLAVVLGLASGAGWFWHRAAPTFERLLSARRAAAADVAEKLRARKAQGWDFWTIEMENLSSELSEERGRLRQRSAEIDQRSARIATEAKELDRVRQDVEAMRREIDQRIIGIRADEAKNLRALAQTYTNLSPHAAVTIFREMDDSTAVKILSLMKPDVVGPIFEDMAKTSGPDGLLARRAAALSDRLRLFKSGVLPATASNGP